MTHRKTFAMFKSEASCASHLLKHLNESVEVYICRRPTSTQVATPPIFLSVPLNAHYSPSESIAKQQYGEYYFRIIMPSYLTDIKSAGFNSAAGVSFLHCNL
eukprot:scaffold298875_cov19-Prasinocladus_malaysianus.AAC.2